MSGIRVGAISRPRRLTNFRLRFANATLAKRPDTSPDTCSVTSEDTTFSSSISTTRSRFKIDANKRFTAICKIADLLHSVADKSDVESLHSLAEVFFLCLKNVLLSLKRRSSRTRSVTDFDVTYRGVAFFGRMFASHVRRVTTRLSATQLTDAFQSSMQALDLTIGSLNTLIDLVEHTAAIVKVLPDVSGDSTLESTIPPSPAIDFPSVNDTLAFATESSNMIPESTLPVEPAADVSGDSVPPTGTRSKKRSLSRLVSGLSRKTVLRSTWSNTISSRTITIPPLSPHADVSSGNSSPSILVASSQPGSSGSDHTRIQAGVSLETDPSGRPFDAKPSTLHNDPPSSEGESTIDPFPSAAEACFSPSGVLCAASLVALVRILTSKEDPEFNALFFLSFRFFSKPLEVFDTLIAQYGMNPPEDLGPAKSISWEKQARVVKIRIAKVFLLWLRLYWRHEWDSDVVEPLRQFASNRPADDPASVTWPKVIKKLRDNPVCVVHRIVRMRQNLEKTLSSSHRPKPFKLFVEDAGRQGNFDEVDILHFHSLGGREELARQLCLAASELFRSFDPEDTVKYWKDGQNKAIGEKISRLSSFENALAYWVSKTIVTRPTARSRAEVLECFVEVAQVSSIIFIFVLQTSQCRVTAMR